MNKHDGFVLKWFSTVNNAIKRTKNGTKPADTTLGALSTSTSTLFADFQRKISPLDKFYRDWDLDEKERDAIDRQFRSVSDHDFHVTRKHIILSFGAGNHSHFQFCAYLSVHSL